LVVVPHVVSWDVADHRGLWRSLDGALSDSELLLLRRRLTRSKEERQRRRRWRADSAEVEERASPPPQGGDGGDGDDAATDESAASRHDVLNEICGEGLGVWSRVILYRSSAPSRDDRRAGGVVRAALPAPFYYGLPHVASMDAGADEADLTGPFPLRYRVPPIVASASAGSSSSPSSLSSLLVDLSLAYRSPAPGRAAASSLPTIDLVPSYGCPDPLARCTRYVALLGDEAPDGAMERVREAHEQFVRGMEELGRQRSRRLAGAVANAGNGGGSDSPTWEASALNRKEAPSPSPTATGAAATATTSSLERLAVLKVYTDCNDPMPA
jgi:hypothetical protein